MNHWRSFLLLTLGLALKDQPLHAQTAASITDTVGSLRITPAQFTVRGAAVEVEEGLFVVPADRHAFAAKRDTSKLRLAFVRFRSTAATPGAPIVFLAGGPGDAATRALAGMPQALLDQLRAIGDVIAFDQRGTGRSEPRGVQCPPGGVLPRDRATTPAHMLEAYTTSIQECLAKALATGVVVSGLTTEENADDIDALRRALGATRVSLLAGSYGTHLALAAARRHAAHIDRAVLLGVEGPDDTFKLPSRVDSVLGVIAASKRPTLAQDIRTLRARLAAAPATHTAPTGQFIVVGEWDLQRWIAESLDTVREIDAMISAIPDLLDAKYSVLAQWAIRSRMPRSFNLMNLAMNCASYASAPRLARISREASTSLLGATIDFPLPELCAIKGWPRLPDSFRTPITGNQRILMISGTFDGRTPPSNAADIVRTLPNSRALVLDGVSHDLFGDPRSTEAMLTYFRGN
ncbi:MAG: alpha/beta hydrolase [Gemmatimonadaceae bacterium]|nr:alpha/beta hydrolase [Gemmatimonadaceae bacterium]